MDVTYVIFGKSKYVSLFIVVEGILDECQSFKTAHKSRLLLALHVHFN